MAESRDERGAEQRGIQRVGLLAEQKVGVTAAKMVGVTAVKIIDF